MQVVQSSLPLPLLLASCDGSAIVENVDLSASELQKCNADKCPEAEAARSVPLSWNRTSHPGLWRPRARGQDESADPKLSWQISGLISTELFRRQVSPGPAQDHACSISILAFGLTLAWSWVTASPSSNSCCSSTKDMVLILGRRLHHVSSLANPSPPLMHEASCEHLLNSSGGGARAAFLPVVGTSVFGMGAHDLIIMMRRLGRPAVAQRGPIHVEYIPTYHLPAHLTTRLPAYLPTSLPACRPTHTCPNPPPACPPARPPARSPTKRQTDRQTNRHVSIRMHMHRHI